MEILKLKGPDHREVLNKAAKAVREGRILVCPTDTVYGLICDAGNREALKRLFEVKSRDKNKPVPLFVKDMKMAKKIARIDKEQELFLKKVWPGKLTAVLKSKKGGTVGLRIPDYKFINQLLLETGRPLTGTSANISGIPGSTKIKEVVSQFQGRKNQPDLIINAGNLKKSQASTVVDLTVLPPKIIRP
ncbi:MAG: L-threonylcarbamoyladenylate synthase [Candidatus Pacebacteria bacterium]|nr:L-threonylcarbamoyladenylate synthase [Candidatus Paceibacterota bacterium]